VQVMSTRFLPMLVSPSDEQVDPDVFADDFTQGLVVVYSFGPPYGRRLVTRTDLKRVGVTGRTLRQGAMANLLKALDRLRIHGEPPALMLSFNGLESSVLLVDQFWDYLSRSVPGDLVVGAPARDVVIVTGSGSSPGVERIRRAVDRVFFAGGEHLLSRDLLRWERGLWVRFVPPEAEESAPARARPPQRTRSRPSSRFAPEPSDDLPPEIRGDWRRERRTRRPTGPPR
jgi:hypothetical protein